MPQSSMARRREFGPTSSRRDGRISRVGTELSAGRCNHLEQGGRSRIPGIIDHSQSLETMLTR